MRQVYRRYRDEFMEILLEKEKDSDEVADDISHWAPRQFICPITQVRDGTSVTVLARVAYV